MHHYINHPFIIAVFAPWIAPHHPADVHMVYKLQPPSWEFPLGTDHLGRCNLSRLLYGARISLGFAMLIFISSLVIGLIVGTISGYKGGWIDQLLMRCCDGVMAFPNLILVLGLVGIFGPGLPQVILALMLVQWVYYARIFRGMVLSLKEENFIAAAKSMDLHNGKSLKIISSLMSSLPRRHRYVGNGLGHYGYLGYVFSRLGRPAPAAEWGAMIHEGKSYIRSNPELMIYPGVMIMIVVVTFNLLGEALSDQYGVKRRF